MEVTQTSNELFIRYNAPFDNHLSVPSTNSYRAVVALRHLSLHQGQRKTKLIITIFILHFQRERKEYIFLPISKNQNWSEKLLRNLPGDFPAPEIPCPGLDGVPVLTFNTAPQVIHSRFWQSTSSKKLMKKLTQKTPLQNPASWLNTIT